MKKIKYIAELCQKHNGSLSRLLDMVDRCADNGADIIKMQSIYINDLTFRPVFENGYVFKKKKFFIKRDYSSEYKRLKKLEINYKDTEKFIKRCMLKKVIPMTTCFSRNRINDLYNLGFKHIKVASYDCGSFQMIRESLKYMDKSRCPTIVNISSIAGRLRSISLSCAYSSSKAAIIGMTRHLAMELSPYEIRVNCLAPGQTITPMLNSALNEPLTQF